MKEPDEKKVERARFVTIGVMWYAHCKKMKFAEAYKYLLVYKGIQFLEENYIYEQTASYRKKSIVHQTPHHPYSSLQKLVGSLEWNPGWHLRSL